MGQREAEVGIWGGFVEGTDQRASAKNIVCNIYHMKPKRGLNSENWCIRKSDPSTKHLLILEYLVDM